MTMLLEARVDPIEAQRFREITQELGITPNEAVKQFTKVFNRHKGFPFSTEESIDSDAVEAFTDEDDATDFTNQLALRLFDETR